MAGEKNGVLPFHSGPKTRHSQKILKLRWFPCGCLVVAALVLAAFCFDLLGRVQSKISSLDRGQKNDISGWDGWDGLDRLFVFGESYSTSMFDVEGTQPSFGNPFGNPQDPNARNLGFPRTGPTGPIWVHWAAMQYNRTFVRTYDLATGGATIDRALVEPVFPTANTFGDQVTKKFAPHYGLNAPHAEWSASSSLFAVFFGMTDMVVSFHNLDRSPVNRLVDSYEAQLDELYRHGARNFLMFTVPPLHRPYPSKKPGLDELAEDIEYFNAGLRKLRDQFTRKHRDTHVWMFDAHAFFTAVIERPKLFYQTSGLVYTKAPCPAYDLGIGYEGTPPLDRTLAKCGVPVNQYFWHDEIHVTYPVHEALAKTVVEDCMGERRRRYCS